MRLITKINIYFGIILILLMASVFIFTDFFVQKEFQGQVENSLQVSCEGLKLTLANINIINEQQAKALLQTKGDILGISTRDKLAAVLYYYLNQAAGDYNLNLIEIVDQNGFLLADNHQAYETDRVRLKLKQPGADNDNSYLTRRGRELYLITTLPIVFYAQRVGYLNLGILVDRNLVAYFSSVLHTNLLFYADQRFLIGNSHAIEIPWRFHQLLKKNPARSVFVPGESLGIREFDYIFLAVPSDPSFTGIIAIARSRSEVLAAFLRLKIFLWGLTGFGLVFGFIGANLLARNIKKSIFGMEPQEIASLLDQRTTILQSTFEGVIALDRNGMITLVNQEARRILPNDLEIIGQTVETFFREIDMKEILLSGQAVYNQQQVIGETVAVYNFVPIKTKLGIIGAVITFRDLTEFQKVAEELVEVKNYTQALRAQSHEFMNKLQSLSGLIQLGRYDKALDLLHETTEAHQDLISMLTHSFAASAVSGILLGKYNRAKELNIKFEIDRASHIPPEISIPDNELVCITGNLIENALEALQESVQSQKAIRIKIYPKNGMLKIAVIDNGGGIPASLKTQIFERGFTTKKGQNKGIGLSLVKQCVENLRGSIKFYRTKENLTIFLVKLPLYPETHSKN
jgi:sensor histidine kinase regulating citrate/malate metabolism/uncharacterized protein YebE (UPF0316 family)